MEKGNDTYYGILMNRIPIVPGIYLFRPSCLIEGNIDSSTENKLFVDTSNSAFYMSEDGDSLVQDDVESIAYVITKEELMTYDSKSLEEAKEKYFEKIMSNAYIGFYISDENTIQIVPYDLESTYINLNNKSNKGDTINCNFDNDDLSKEDAEKLEGIFSAYESKDACIIPLETLEDIVNQQSLEDMKKKLDELYSKIKLLEDDSISFKVGNEEFGSIVRCFNCGDDIIQLFIDSYNSLLSIDNMEVMKNSLEQIRDVYENLYQILEENKDKFDSVEAARDFLLVFIDSYDRMLKMDSLESIKEEIIKLKTSEEERILEIAVIYDKNISKKSINAKEDDPNILRQNQIDKLLEQLNSLIGLSNVKKVVQQLVAYLDYVGRTREIHNLENPNLNMVFKGNPGTGKTTVARILAKLLYQLGYSKKDKFIEITAQDLIAGYVGQTALKTRKLLDENKGGVIFLDEAYIMCNQSDSFAEEALVEILKEMESKNTIFIFAGYQKEMTDFIEMNPGLSSRIGSIIEFEDYQLDELLQILIRKLNMHNLILDSEAKQVVSQIIDCKRNQENFGNGRYINRLFDKIIMNHAQNCKGIDDIESLKTISVDDLEGVLEKVKEKTIGFKTREE